MELENLDPKTRWRKKNREKINRKQREYYRDKKNGVVAEPKRKPKRIADPVTPRQRKAIDEMTLANIGATRKMIVQASKQYKLKADMNGN